MRKRIRRIVSILCAAAMLVAALWACNADSEGPSAAQETQTPPVQSEPINEPSYEPIDEPNYEPDDDQVGEFGAGDKRFELEGIREKDGSPLKNKTIYWLGSSVTVGINNHSLSMAEYLAARTGAISVKDAISGTTILDTGVENSKSYTSRLVNSERYDTAAPIDAFICQISTNDAKSENINFWGAITDADVTDMDAFDLSTSIGGVEFIIAYVTETWHCPVYFYSGAYFGDDGPRSNADPSGSDYGQFVNEVIAVAEKWNAIDGYTVEVIDLYHDEDFNARVSDTYYEWCMRDAIHPMQAGYLQWWTPYFEEFLSERLG